MPAAKVYSLGLEHCTQLYFYGSVLPDGTCTVGLDGQWDMSVQWDTWDSTGLSVLSHGAVGLDGQWDMAECIGTHRIPLDCPSCPMVQWDGMDGTARPDCVGCHIDVQWTLGGKNGVKSPVQVGVMDILWAPMWT